MPNPSQNPSGVLVVDFGAQYAQLIARRVREANVYSEIVPSSITSNEVRAKNPAAIILSGGPNSVYESDTPKAPNIVFECRFYQGSGNLLLTIPNY
mgnify:CR=1 FL=1